jgi:hypothetical protein
MIKRLLAVALLAGTASACAPVMRSASLETSEMSCASGARLAANDAACASAPARALVQEPQEKKPPVEPGPGKKDFTTWMALLTMGFAALYLMAFK